MRRLLALKFVAAILCVPSAALAQPAKLVRIPWLVTEVPDDVREVTLQKEQAVPFARLIPAAPLRLKQDVLVRGKVFLPKNTEMARSDVSGAIFCEITRRPGFDFFKCLEDTDGDEAIDNYSSVFAREYYYGRTVEREYLMQPLEPWNHHDIAPSLPLFIFDRAAEGRGVLLQLKISKINEKRVDIAFCGAPIAGVSEFCMKWIEVKPTEIGVEIPVLGGSIKVTGRTIDSVTLSIVRPRGSARLN